MTAYEYYQVEGRALGRGEWVPVFDPRFATLSQAQAEMRRCRNHPGAIRSPMEYRIVHLQAVVVAEDKGCQT